MAKVICAHSGCGYEAVQRCNQCDRSYCIQHIGQKQSLICDSCIASNTKSGGLLMKRGRNILLIGLLIMILFILPRLLGIGIPMSPFIFIGGILFWIGVIVCIVGAVRSSKRE